MTAPDIKPTASQDFARENAAYNRAWFADLQEKVRGGEPLAYVHISVPTEIFKAMGIPVIVNQWWSSVVGSRGKGQRVRGFLGERGYRPNLCSYCSTGLASLFETDPDEAAWGGLPRPTVLASGANCSNVGRIFDLFSTEFGIPHHAMALATNPRSIANHVARAGDDWAELYSERQLDLQVEQFQGLIRFLEAETGKRFDEGEFRRIMRLVDEQENYYRLTRNLIATARPTPMNIVDQLPATVIPQWHRGTEWARDRAKLFYERTKAMVEQGEAACDGEQARLMWLGIGLWHNLRFYEHFQREHGAVFAWNEYLALGADGYRVAMDESDPLRTLAGRMSNVMTVVAQDSWYLEQFRQAGLDGVVIMEGGGSQKEGGGCNSQFGRAQRTRDIFRRAGIPMCVINADPVNAAGFDEDSLKSTISRFIVEDVLPNKTQGV